MCTTPSAISYMGLQHLLVAVVSQDRTAEPLLAIARLAAVHLVDAHLAADPAKYMAALLASLAAMLHLELPHVNVLSKADLVEAYGELRFNLDFYTEVSILMSAACHCLPSDICVW